MGRAFGLYIVGDEILSGKRQDRHFEAVRGLFAARGLSLSWVHYLGDDRARCVAAFRASFNSGEPVFSCGGIGSTPDDHTREAAAEALGLPLVLHPQAEELIRQRAAESGQPVTPDRLRMGEFPQGAAIIPNPYNKIPGFFIQEHYFLPGFPVMAWPMIEWVLDQHYRDEFRQHSEFDYSMLVYRLLEASATPLMRQLLERYPQVKIYSLPSAGDHGMPRHLELGVKAAGTHAAQAEAPEVLKAAYQFLREGVIALGGQIEEERQSVR